MPLMRTAIIALLNYLSVDDLYRQQIITLLSQWKERQLSLNPLETNPFRYMRLTGLHLTSGSVNNQEAISQPEKHSPHPQPKPGIL